MWTPDTKTYESKSIDVGVKVDLPVLTEKDINDLKEFACKHKVDYVAASFVQSAADVCFIRSVLDEAGGFDIKIISKIENQEGLNNFKEVRQLLEQHNCMPHIEAVNDCNCLKSRIRFCNSLLNMV